MFCQCAQTRDNKAFYSFYKNTCVCVCQVTGASDMRNKSSTLTKQLNCSKGLSCSMRCKRLIRASQWSTSSDFRMMLQLTSTSHLFLSPFEEDLKKIKRECGIKRLLRGVFFNRVGVMYLPSCRVRLAVRSKFLLCVTSGNTHPFYHRFFHHNDKCHFFMHILDLLIVSWQKC